MLHDSLGDRMKAYEEVSKTKLVRRMPVIIRLDGKAFHTFTRGFRKPFDDLLINTMQATMKYLCENVQGCVLGYTQSDEITLVLVDYARLESSAWFDNEVQKLVSVSASLATFAFNKYFNELYLEQLAEKGETDSYDLVYDAARRKGALFDSRAFNVPKEDVVNCLLWRQQDAERNSINSLAQSIFSHKELQGVDSKTLVSKLEKEKNVIWGNIPTTCKRGSCCIRKYYMEDLETHIVYDAGDLFADTEGGLYRRSDNKYIGYSNFKESSKWEIDDEIPIFKYDGREYIEKLIYVGE